MTISNALLIPGLSKLKEDFASLEQILQNESSDNALALKESIESELDALDQLNISLLEGKQRTEFFESYRDLKLKLRFAQRKWRRMISNESRNRKMQEKERGSNVAAAVA